MKTVLRPALVMLVLGSALLGLAYPALVTAVAQGAFPRQAGGSLVERDGRAVGSERIGQAFRSPHYFWGRPGPYDGRASGASNLGPSHPALRERVAARVAELRAADPGNRAPVPVDLATASASGLDPDISAAAAFYQVPRVARARGLPVPVVRELVRAYVREPALGFLGEARANVLELNLALDRIRSPADAL